MRLAGHSSKKWPWMWIGWFIMVSLIRFTDPLIALKADRFGPPFIAFPSNDRYETPHVASVR